MAVELEAHLRCRFAVGPDAVVVGPQRRPDHSDEGAQDPVLVQARDGLQAGGDCVGDLLLGAVASPSRTGCRAVRVEPGLEQLDQLGRERGVGHECGLLVLDAERGPDLSQVPGDRAQDDHLPPVQAGGEDEGVQGVALGAARPDGDERLLERIRRRAVIAPDLGAGSAQAEVVDVHIGVVAVGDLVRPLVDDLQAEVGEHRQHVGQGQRVAPVELEAADPG